MTCLYVCLFLPLNKIYEAFIINSYRIVHFLRIKTYTFTSLAYTSVSLLSVRHIQVLIQCGMYLCHIARPRRNVLSHRTHRGSIRARCNTVFPQYVCPYSDVPGVPNQKFGYRFFLLNHRGSLTVMAQYTDVRDIQGNDIPR